MTKRNGEMLLWLLRKRKKLKKELKVGNSSKYVQEKSMKLRSRMRKMKLMMLMIMMRITMKNSILKLFRNISTRNLHLNSQLL